MGVKEDCVGYASYDNRLFPFMHADFLLMCSRERLPPPAGTASLHFSIIEENQEDINLQSREQVSARFHRRSRPTTGRVSVFSPLTSAIYDNIYQRPFDPPQNLTRKLRELISSTCDMNYGMIETAAALRST